MIDSLIEAQTALENVAGTDADRAAALSRVLTAALEAHQAHGDQPCPVCGVGSLDAGWRRTATDEAERLGRDAVAAWRGMQDLPDSATAIAEHLERSHPLVVDAVTAVKDRAREELDRRNAEWVPLARALTTWAEHACEALAADVEAKNLEAGERWLKQTTAELRDERFAPIAQQAQVHWEQLRQQSSVRLDDVVLTGAATRRRLELSVSIDGSDSSALGVMSQGELHALALSLFLPRATLPESPFRFLVIDDPVQSMDPARVDGLAKVLDHVARDRQVIVFTHDDRLPESVRRLNIDARVIGVVRRSQSRVEVREQLEPVARNLDDARALAKSDDVPDVIVANVVPGLCRTAIEAACVEAVRRRRLAHGEGHAEVEQAIGELTSTFTYAAVALFDDPDRGSDVFARVNRWGHHLGDVLRWCKEGAHGASGAQSRQTLIANVDATRSLAGHLRAQQ